MQDMSRHERAANALRATLAHLASLVSAGGQAVPKLARVALGIGTVSAERHAARLAVCRACPGGHYQGGVCGQLVRRTGSTCGCLVDKKAWLASEQCPNGYWSQ